MLAIGAIGGMHEYFTIYAAFFSVLIGGAMALVVFLWHGRLLEGLKGALRFTFSVRHVDEVSGGDSEDEQQQQQEESAVEESTQQLTVPYGVAIAVGTAVAWYTVELL
jgi:hypothetical protein